MQLFKTVKTVYRDFKIVGSNDEYIFAEVERFDTTLSLFSSSYEVNTIRVYKYKNGSYWRFAETGEFTPGDVIEELASATEARIIAKELGIWN